ncbi:phage tail spike protein [Vagococcus sp. CY52-2]|uniref:phage tail spike protein n=2 Tax=Vagococcus sp. CY52-2 TaxID=2925838 RepID=UPI002739E055|nr:phage tail spike protein [Vagococcus sp. CY52-2]
MTVYFFDDNQQSSKIVTKNNLIECIQEKEISDRQDDLMKNTLKVTVAYDKVIEESSFMAVEEKENEFSLYRILTNADNNNKLSIVGSDFAYNELDGYIVKEIRPQKESIVSVARRLLSGTEWQIRHVDSGLNTVSGSFYYTSIRESLKTLQTFGCEIEFRCSLNSDGIHEKWINIYKRIGENTGKRFTYGDDVLEIVKTIDRTNLYTSVIGRGKGEEVGETEQGDATYGRRIEFADIEWSKSKGDPLDKPLGQIYLENPELTQIYGIPQKDGTMRKRETVVIFEDEEDPKELLKKTYAQLQVLSRPLIQFKTTVLNGDAIGNTVSIHHFEKGYHYETRVFRTTLDRLTGRLECSLGDNITQSVSKANAKQINSIKEIEEKKTSYYDATKISKWQSDVIRGAGEEGGNVFLMSPSDLGTGTSRAPVQTVWMNGPNIDESDNFLVANNKGIGFIKGKFATDKFATAWDINGILTLGDGMLILGDKESGKILQNTKDGLEFFNTKSSIGKIGNSAVGFPGFSEQGSDTSSKALAIVLNDEGEFFKIQTGKMSGIYVPNPEKFKKLGSDLIITHGTGDTDGIILATAGTSIGLSGKGGETANQIKINATGGLFLNGEQVFPGKGGGSGGGSGSGNIGTREDYAKNMITDEFDVDYEKMFNSYLGFPRIQAWGLNSRASFNQLNEIIRSQGVSPVFFWAYESGEGYNPSTSFLNHFYTNGSSAQEECRRTAAWVHSESQTSGALAWYDAMYPYYTSPADKQAKGNAYMAETRPGMIARVMLKGTAAATWAMFDPAALSGSVNGVQDYSDPFKHQMSAIASWQGVKKYGKPMANYIVTSEFGWRTSPLGGGSEFHNAIDLASNGGRADIFASNDGTVVQASGQYYDWYGNYVVIKHSDGLYTGYAHLSSIGVTNGQKVSKGQKIGVEGATGPVTGPHLHFQFMKNFWPNGNDDFINPRKYINF